MPTPTPIEPTQIPASIARSWLLVNAADSAAVDQARAGHADIVVLDLEDGVLEAARPAAREHTHHQLTTGSRLWVRINNASTLDWARDLEMLSTATPAGVVLAKAEDPSQIRRTAAGLESGVPIVAMIESARGLENVRAIAAASPTVRLAFGSGDFRLDTGISGDALSLAYTRSRRVIASRAAQIDAPIDGPTLTSDPHELQDHLKIGSAAGMSGKLCLSAAHIDPINKAFTPSPSDRQWAHDLIEELGADGSGIRRGSERPQLARALRIRDLAASFATAVLRLESVLKAGAVEVPV